MKQLLDYFNLITVIVGILSLIPAIYAIIQGNIKYSLYFLIICIVIFLFYFINDQIRGNKIKYAVNDTQSKKFVKCMYDRIKTYLKKKHRITLWDANLQVTKPADDVWEEDINMSEFAKNTDANGNRIYRIHWHVVFVETPDKKDWIQKWRDQIAAKNPNCNISIVPIATEGNYILPLVNFFVIPELGESFIGFGRYKELDLDGGGIWIRNKTIAQELSNIVAGWQKAGH